MESGRSGSQQKLHQLQRTGIGGPRWQLRMQQSWLEPAMGIRRGENQTEEELRKAEQKWSSLLNLRTLLEII